jgi:hypothetical protein
MPHTVTAVIGLLPSKKGVCLPQLRSILFDIVVHLFGAIFGISLNLFLYDPGGMAAENGGGSAGR